MRGRTGRKRKVAGAPSTEQQEKLCQEYLKDYNAYRAALRAGYSKSWARKSSTAMVRSLMPTIDRLQTKKSEHLVKRGIMSQEEVLHGMSNIGRFNPLDYIKIVEEKRGGQVKLVAKLKDITELSPDLADAISEISEAGGTVTYKLPDINAKMAARAFIGKHWGLTDPKLVNLRITQNISMNAELREVDSDTLEELEGQLIKLLGPAAQRLLGYRPGEDEEQEPIEQADDDEEDEDD